MKKRNIAVSIISIAVVFILGLKTYDAVRLSNAIDESELVWMAVQGASKTDGGTLPSTIKDRSGREYMILRTDMNNQRSNEILAVSWGPVINHQHIVIYQSGKSEARSSEELTTRLLEEIKDQK